MFKKKMDKDLIEIESLKKRIEKLEFTIKDIKKKYLDI